MVEAEISSMISDLGLPHKRDEIAKNLLRSKDFNKLDSRIEDQVDGLAAIKTTTTTKSSETLTKTKTFETKKASTTEATTNGVSTYDDR